MPKAKAPKQKVTFSYFAPTASAVLLAGQFTGWQEKAVALTKSKTGLWKKTVSLPAGRHAYRFIVDGQWLDDPECPHREPNEFGGENCVCLVEDSYP